MKKRQIRLGQRTKETLIVGLDSAQEVALFVKGSLNSTNKGLSLVSETLDESLFEAKEDSMEAKVNLIKAVLVAEKELIKLGMSEEEARETLKHYR
jgi:hypothetical protein